MRIPHVDDIVGTHAGKLALLAAVALALLIDAAITPPTWDDVVLSHRILGSPPFYDDHFDMYLPVFKPLAAIQLPARFFPYPWSYLYVSLTHAVLLAAGAWLTYMVALRYVRRDTAMVAGGLTLLLTAAHYWNTPTRPEAWLLAVLLGVVYLCDTWRLTGRTAFLAAACVLAGALGLSMHTNASIIYIYLALFALWRRRQFTLRDWAVGAVALAASSLVGLGVLLIPQPEALLELLTHYDGRASWDIGLREFRRWRWYAVNLRVEPLFPMSVVFGATAIVAIAARRPGLVDARSFAKRYAGLLIIGLAAFIGLGVLPSAAHPQYAAFYLPTLTVLAALAWQHRPSSRVGALVCWVATVCVTGALALGLPAYARGGGGRDWLDDVRRGGVLRRIGGDSVRRLARQEMGVGGLRARNVGIARFRVLSGTIRGAPARGPAAPTAGGGPRRGGDIRQQPCVGFQGQPLQPSSKGAYERRRADRARPGVFARSRGRRWHFRRVGTGSVRRD